MDTDNTHWRFSTGYHKQFAAEYLIEIRELANAAALPNFEHIASQFSNFQQYLESRAKLKSPLQSIIHASNGSGIIDVTTDNSIIRDAMMAAHIAASCHLLHSSKLPLSSLKRTKLIPMARQFLKSCEGKAEDYRRRMVNKFHTMDAVRTIQFLRALGLVTRPSQEMYQLAIGSADGTRDILSIHLIPRIYITNESDSQFISLYADRQIAAETIIIDSATEYIEHYAELNNDETVNAIAYNRDTIDVLKVLPNELSHKRNLITGLRIDHRMLPDIEEFLKYLAPCIDAECDLILTIGAGDTVKDFEGRINKFKEIFSALKRAGLQPLIFKLHGSGSISKQQKSLYFGNVRASSYEILYCKIGANALSKYFE